MTERRALLVTGGTGFIGRHLATRAQAEGWRVVTTSRAGALERPGTLDVRSDGEGASVSDHLRGALRQDADRRAWALEAPLPADLLEGIDAVVHLAYARGPDAVALNLRATERLLAAAGPRSVVFASSLSARQGVASAYGQQKLACERAVLAAGQRVVRLGLVLGDGGLFAALSAHLARWRVVPVVGDGRQPVQALAVDEAAGALLAALGRPGPAELTVAAPAPVPYRDFVTAVAARLGVTPTFVRVPRALVRAGVLARRLRLPAPDVLDSLASLLDQRAWATASSLAALGLTLRPLDEVLGARSAGAGR